MFDFIIASMPRSGSHMLAFALDSHPEVSISGEVQNSRYEDRWSNNGRLKGAIVHHPNYDKYADTLKVIAMLRKPESLIEARERMVSPLHVFRGEADEVSARRNPLNDRWREIIRTNYEGLVFKLKQHNDVLWLDYDVLTEGKSVDVLPCSREVCDFLDIKPMELETKTIKPKVVYED